MASQRLVAFAIAVAASCFQAAQAKKGDPSKAVIKQAVKDAIKDCSDLPEYGAAWAKGMWCGTDKLQFQNAEILAFVKEQEKTIMTSDPKYANEMMTKIWDKLRNETNIGDFEKAQNYTKCVYEKATTKLNGNKNVVYNAGVSSIMKRHICNITKTRLFLDRSKELTKRIWRAGKECGVMAFAAAMAAAACESAFAWVCFLPLMVWNHDQNPLPNWVRNLLRKTKHCMERAAMGYEYRYVHYSNYSVDMCEKDNPPPADVATEDALAHWRRTGPCKVRVSWPEDKDIKHQTVIAIGVCLKNKRFDENDMKEAICDTLDGSFFSKKARAGRKTMKQFMGDMNSGTEDPEKVLKVLKKKGLLGPLKIFKAFQFFKCVQQVAGDALYCPNAARSYSVMRKIKMTLCCKDKKYGVWKAKTNFCGTKYYLHHVFVEQLPEIFIMFGAKAVICLYAPHIWCHFVGAFIVATLVYDTIYQMVTAVNKQHECTPTMSVTPESHVATYRFAYPMKSRQ